MTKKGGSISPAKLRACHQLAVQAQAHALGQDVLFRGPARYDFPEGQFLREDELPVLRKYIAEKTRLSLEYTVTSSGVIHPEQLELDLGQTVSLPKFESVASYTMQAWKYGVDEGKIGMYFMPCGDDSRLEKRRFRAVEFTPDCNSKMSPARDEELRHKLRLSLVGYLNRENIEVNAFPTLATRTDSAAIASA